MFEMKETIATAVVCPRCKKVYTDRPAISRVDGKTTICPDCSTREALESIGIDTAEQDKILMAIHGIR